jgi:hypothetical protein
VFLRRIIAEGDKTKSEILRGESIVNLSDPVARSVDIPLLTFCNVLEEHDIPESNLRSASRKFHVTKRFLQWRIGARHSVGSRIGLVDHCIECSGQIRTRNVNRFNC